MLKNDIELLAGAYGIPGQEQEVSSLARDMLAPLVDETEIDDMYNVIGRRYSKHSDMPRVMLNAHIDQVGLIVTDILKGGFVKAASYGVDARALLGLKMLIITREETIRCFGTAIPPHMQEDKDEERPVEISDVYFDTGMSDNKLRMLVRPGDPIVFDSKVKTLLNNRITGAALDDRAGIACILDALRQIKDHVLPYELYVLFSTMEEINHQGCLARMPIDKPDYIITVDMCHGATIGGTEYDRVHQLGCGAVITMGANSVPKFSNHLINVARKYEIPFQREALPASTYTDAWAAQTAYKGAYTAVVSLPLRHMHTPTEVIDLRDAEAVSSLLAQFCKEFGGSLD